MTHASCRSRLVPPVEGRFVLVPYGLRQADLWWLYSAPVLRQWRYAVDHVTVNDQWPLRRLRHCHMSPSSLRDCWMGVSVYDWDSQCGIWLQRRSAICFPTKHEQPVNSSCRQLIDMRPFEFWIASGIGKQHGVIGAAQGVFRADKRWIGESAFKVRGHQTDESGFATWCLNIGCFDIPKLIGCFENKSSCMCGELTCVVQSLGNSGLRYVCGGCDVV